MKFRGIRDAGKNYSVVKLKESMICEDIRAAKYMPEPTTAPVGGVFY